MGNLIDYFKTNKKDLEELGLSETDTKNDRLYIIDKIIKNTVIKTAKKLLNKKIISYDNTDTIKDENEYFDIEKLNDYFNTEYYITKDKSKNEYYYLNKKEYVLLLFRVIEHMIPDISINDVFFRDFYNKNLSILSKDNQYLEPIYCNLDIKINYIKNKLFIINKKK